MALSHENDWAAHGERWMQRNIQEGRMGVEKNAKEEECRRTHCQETAQLQMFYVPYMELEVCAERFAEFENAKSSLRDVLKRKETGLPPEQVERVWNMTAEKFKQLEAVLKVAGDAQLYTECERTRKYVAGLILLVPGMGGPSQDVPARKKDF
jgi:hypothetical protein